MLKGLICTAGDLGKNLKAEGACATWFLRTRHQGLTGHEQEEHGHTPFITPDADPHYFWFINC